MLEVKQTLSVVQLRFLLPSGGKVAICEALQEGSTGPSHHHKGFVEVYTVHSGTLLLYADSTRGPCVHVLGPQAEKCTLVVPEHWNHAVYALPDTAYVVQTIGEPTVNRARGSDWWPAPPSFIEYSSLRLHEVADSLLRAK